jgi:hypothetical protein
MRILLCWAFLFVAINLSYSQTQKYLGSDGKPLHYCIDKQIDSVIDANANIYLSKVSDSEIDKKKFKKHLNSAKDKFNKTVWDEVLRIADVSSGKETKDVKKSKSREFKKLLKHLSEATIMAMDGVKKSYENELNADKIQSFYSSFDIRKDGTMRVIETITVLNTETGSINKGIVRYIPDSYDIGYGLNFKMIIRVEGIFLNEQPVKYEEGFNSGSKLLYIGNSDSALSLGRQFIE